MSEWTVEYNNDVDAFDGCFAEWWEVSNDDKGITYRSDCEQDAKTLCEKLNMNDYAPELYKMLSIARDKLSLHMVDVSGDGNDFQDFRVLIDNLLAKARGEQQ